MAERFYSVVAEFGDGTTKVMPVRGESSGEAFRQVRGMPDVRRVGRVTEVASAAAAEHAAQRGVAPLTSSSASSSSASKSPEPAVGPAPAQSAAATNWVGHVISGPRTVVYAPPPAGGEQPFKHLHIPPERLKPQPPPEAPKPRPAKPQAAAPSKPAVAIAPATNGDAAPIPMPATTAVEYRIAKSRRRDGLPYLLQRGQWQQAGGKRTFDVQWEKGFDDRAAAELHLDWVKQTERELTEFHQSA